MNKHSLFSPFVGRAKIETVSRIRGMYPGLSWNLSLLDLHSYLGKKILRLTVSVFVSFVSLFLLTALLLWNKKN